jgi:hypothetical protein
LLKSLQSHTSKLALQNRRSEAVEIRSLSKRLFILVVRPHFRELRLNSRMVLGQSSNPAQGLGGLVVSVLLDEKAGRLGEDAHSAKEDEGVGELDGDGDAVGARVLALGCGVVDDGGEEETDRNGPLVGSYDGTANPLGSCFGLVEGDCDLLERLRVESAGGHTDG